mgnify:CR=1 FL=1
MTSPRYCGQCGCALHEARSLPGAPCPACDCWWFVTEPVSAYPSPEVRDEWLIIIALACGVAALLCLSIWGQAQ